MEHILYLLILFVVTVITIFALKIAAPYILKLMASTAEWGALLALAIISYSLLLSSQFIKTGRDAAILLTLNTLALLFYKYSPNLRHIGLKVCVYTFFIVLNFAASVLLASVFWPMAFLLLMSYLLVLYCLWCCLRWLWAVAQLKPD